jgi:hypothetical protein
MRCREVAAFVAADVCVPRTLCMRVTRPSPPHNRKVLKVVVTASTFVASALEPRESDIVGGWDSIQPKILPPRIPPRPQQPAIRFSTPPAGFRMFCSMAPVSKTLF